MIASTATDFFWLAIIVGLCAACLFIASRIEPHWVSRDGHRFMTTGQELDQWGLPFGRRKELRVRIDDDAETLVLSRRSLVRPGTGQWVVDAKSPEPPKGRVVYLIKQVTSANVIGTMAMRLPANSKVIARLDELLASTGAEAEQARQVERRRVQQARRSPTAASDPPETPPPAPPTDPG